MKKRVFLGGTTNNTTWRDDLIPRLEVGYFNPVVDDWTEDCIKVEDDEKNNKCTIHLYVITSKMIGVYSIAEAVQSSRTEGKLTIFCVLDKDNFNKAQLKSLEATEKLLQGNGAVICKNLDEVANKLNSDQVVVSKRVQTVLKEAIEELDKLEEFMAPSTSAFGQLPTPVVGNVVTNSDKKDDEDDEKEENKEHILDNDLEKS